MVDDVLVVVELIQVARAVKSPAKFIRELVLLVDLVALGSIQQCSQAGFVTHWKNLRDRLVKVGV